MNETKQFIEDAIKGGGMGEIKPETEIEVTFEIEDFVTLRLGDKELTISLHKALLMPEIWEAVGKTRGWDKKIETCPHEHSECADFTQEEWLHNMHTFIDLLADGKTKEEALTDLQ